MKREYQYLLSDKMEQDAIAELNRMLDEELAKPPQYQSEKQIEEITRAYAVITGQEKEIAEAAERGLHRAAGKAAKPAEAKPAIRMKRKRNLPLAFVAAAAAVVLAANTATVLAYQQNIVSFLVEKSETSFSVVPLPEEEIAIELPTSEDDPYGIRARCAEFGLDVEVPTYLPEGLVLWDVDEQVFHAGESDYIAKKYIYFRYRKGKTTLGLRYAEVNDPNARIRIPSDEFNLEEIFVNGKPGITSKEDGQYNLVYYDGNMEYFITSNHLDYEECDRIVASIAA